MDYNHETAEKLISRLVANPISSEANYLANDLLNQFHQGYPLESLRPLLVSQDLNLAGIATWIASELGVKGKALLPEITTLLTHPSKRVRFFAIDCILVWANPSNTLALASAIKPLNDAESAVRWKAMNFLTQATREQLQGAYSYMEVTEPETMITIGLGWLLDAAALDSDGITANLKQSNALLRKFAAVAAARISMKDSAPLSFAASISDPDIVGFADFKMTRNL